MKASFFSVNHFRGFFTSPCTSVRCEAANYTELVDPVKHGFEKF